MTSDIVTTNYNVNTIFKFVNKIFAIICDKVTKQRCVQKFKGNCVIET